MRLYPDFGVVNVLKPADHQNGVDGDSINANHCKHITFVLQFGDITDDAVLTINSGATDGTKTTAETFTYALAGADQGATGADVYGAEATSAALTLTAATYDNRVLIVEVPVASLTDGQPYVTLSLDAAAAVLNASCVAILHGLRYSENPTAIA